MPKQVLGLAAVLACGFVAWTWSRSEPVAAFAAEPLPGAIQLLPADIKWKESDQEHGLFSATLAGNPNARGPYCQRIKLPANFKLAPHSHPNANRMVTVLEGTLFYGFGDQFDETKLKAFPPGSFFTEPAYAAHFAMTKDEEVVLELHATGPAGTKYVGR